MRLVRFYCISCLAVIAFVKPRLLRFWLNLLLSRFYLCLWGSSYCISLCRLGILKSSITGSLLCDSPTNVIFSLSFMAYKISTSLIFVAIQCPWSFQSLWLSPNDWETWFITMNSCLWIVDPLPLFRHLGGFRLFLSALSGRLLAFRPWANSRCAHIILSYAPRECRRLRTYSAPSLIWRQ